MGVTDWWECWNPSCASGKPLVEMPGLSVRAGPVKATDKLGRHSVVFNRGIISTQSLSHRLPKGKGGTPSADKLRKHIEAPGDGIRKGWAGEAIEAMTSLLRRARDEGGKSYCALYELTDPELMRNWRRDGAEAVLRLRAAQYDDEFGPLWEARLRRVA